MPPSTSSPSRSPRVRRRPRGWRWLIGGLVALVLGAMVAIATLPWWLGLALRTAAAAVDGSFARYERLGYARWAVHDLRVAWPGGELHATRVEAPTPLVWLMAPPKAAVQVGEVSVALAKTREPAPTESPALPGWRSLHDKVTMVSAGLRGALPEFTAASVTLDHAGRRFTAREVRWDAGTLRAAALQTPFGHGPVEIVWPFDADAPAKISVALGDWRLAANATRERADGTLEWRGQTAPWSATWAEDRWPPSSAELKAEAWTFPTTLLGLPSDYEAVRGDLALAWQEGVVQVRGSGAAEARGRLPAVTVRFAGEGGTQQLALSELAADAPGLRAKLAAPLTITWRDGVQLSATELEVEADLAQWPLLGATGTLRGRVTARPPAELSFTARGEDLRWRDAVVRRIEIEGGFADSRLTLQRVRGEADFGDVDAKGVVEFAARTLALELKARLAESARLPWKVPNLAWREAQLTAKLEGPLQDPAHEGNLRVTGLATPRLREVDAADVSWRASTLTTGEAELRASGGDVRLAAQFTSDGAKREGVLTQMVLSAADRELIALEAPARLAWLDGFALDAPGLRGAALSGAVRWDRRGWHVRLEQLDTAAFDPLLVRPPAQALRGQDVVIDVDWIDTGAATGRTTAHGTVQGTRAGRAWPFDLAVQAEEAGLLFEKLRLGAGGAEALTVQGRVPLVLTPGTRSRWRPLPAGAWDLDVRAQPEAEFWAEAGEGLGATLIDPQVSARVQGVWGAPEFSLEANVARVAPRRTTARWWPEIVDARVQARADRTGLELTSLGARVAGQAFTANARWPVPPERWWSAARAPTSEDWSGLEGEIKIDRAEIAPIVENLGGWVAPTGWFEARVARDAQGAVTGHLKLVGLATRPVFPWGALQDVTGTVWLNGRSLDLGGVTALAGGQPVRVTGIVADIGQAAPRFDLALEAQRVPLVRQPGVSVRSDLKLQARTDDQGTTHLTGDVTLRDSLFLTDVRALLPSGGPRAPESRPPWFSVARAPLADWTLGVVVKGDRFLRVRTPIFRGLVSADFRLEGTLRTPRAIGEARVEEGDIMLPFASFEVTQGTVALRPADPYEPQLLLNGESQRFGYDLQLEVAGTAQKPRLTLTSSPPLTQEQALLLVTAGVVPRDEEFYSGRDRLTRLGTFVGQSLLAGSGESELARRLTISSGAKISRQGRETYEVNFELADRWILAGEYDEFDAYNAGVRWRVLRDAAVKKTEPEAK